MTKYLVFLLYFLGWAAGLAAQTSTSYDPARALQNRRVAALRTADVHYLPQVNNAEELARTNVEVIQIPGLGTMRSGAFRFGVTFPVDIRLGRATAPLLTPNGSIRQLIVRSPCAYSINLAFTEFKLSPGARVKFYNSDSSMVVLPFGLSDLGGQPETFATDLMMGDVFVIELWEPRDEEGQSSMRIAFATHGFRDTYASLRTPMLVNRCFWDRSQMLPCEQDAVAISGVEVPLCQSLRPVELSVLYNGSRLHNDSGADSTAQVQWFWNPDQVNLVIDRSNDGATATAYSVGNQDAGSNIPVAIRLRNQCGAWSSTYWFFIKKCPAPVQFLVGPNPTSNLLSIWYKLSGNRALNIPAFSVQLHNEMGRQVRSGQSEPGQSRLWLNVADLPTGLYHLYIEAEGQISHQLVKIDKRSSD